MISIPNRVHLNLLSSSCRVLNSVITKRMIQTQFLMSLSISKQTQTHLEAVCFLSPPFVLVVCGTSLLSVSRCQNLRIGCQQERFKFYTLFVRRDWRREIECIRLARGMATQGGIFSLVISNTPTIIFFFVIFSTFNWDGLTSIFTLSLSAKQLDG